MRGIKIDVVLLWKYIYVALVWLVEIVLFKFRVLAINYFVPIGVENDLVFACVGENYLNHDVSVGDRSWLDRSAKIGIDLVFGSNRKIALNLIEQSLVPLQQYELHIDVRAAIDALYSEFNHDSRTQ